MDEALETILILVLILAIFLMAGIAIGYMLAPEKVAYPQFPASVPVEIVAANYSRDAVLDKWRAAFGESYKHEIECQPYQNIMGGWALSTQPCYADIPLEEADARYSESPAWTVTAFYYSETPLESFIEEYPPGDAKYIVLTQTHGFRVDYQFDGKEFIAGDAQPIVAQKFTSMEDVANWTMLTPKALPEYFIMHLTAQDMG